MTHKINSCEVLALFRVAYKTLDSEDSSQISDPTKGFKIQFANTRVVYNR